MIDFTTAFAKKKIERLQFKTRENVNYLHEIVFLSSYLHDATFNVADLSFTKGTLTIPIDRDCWEYWTRIRRIKKELLGCRSLLTISGVTSLKWSRKRLPSKVEINTIFMGEEQFLLRTRHAHLVFLFSERLLRLDLRGEDFFFNIELNDLEDPK